MHSLKLEEGQSHKGIHWVGAHQKTVSVFDYGEMIQASGQNIVESSTFDVYSQSTYYKLLCLILYLFSEYIVR
jgi:hypothetical protein